MSRGLRARASRAGADDIRPLRARGGSGAWTPRLGDDAAGSGALNGQEREAREPIFEFGLLPLAGAVARPSAA